MSAFPLGGRLALRGHGEFLLVGNDGESTTTAGQAHEGGLAPTRPARPAGRPGRRGSELGRRKCGSWRRATANEVAPATSRQRPGRGDEGVASSQAASSPQRERWCGNRETRTRRVSFSCLRRSRTSLPRRAWLQRLPASFGRKSLLLQGFRPVLVRRDPQWPKRLFDGPGRDGTCDCAAQRWAAAVVSENE
jgi:hypothetical protein